MKLIKVSTQKPPQWILDEVKNKFDVDWESNVVFTYGPVISTASGWMTEDLITHESNHTIQQEKYGGADKWWREYLDNPEFRFLQELECYQKQYQWLIKNVKDRNEVFKFLNHYAKSLSGEMYGKLVSYNEALTKIKNGN